MTPEELEKIFLVCKKHGQVLALEVNSKGGVKVQYYPVPADAGVAMPTENALPARKEPEPEEVQTALHLGGGRG